MKILVVEDERKVRHFITSALEQAGFAVDAVSTLADARALMDTKHRYDAIVLDRLLGGNDAIEAIADFRSRAPDARILILSALADVEEKIRGLGLGADDYLGKPFHVAELIARLRAITRRAAHQPPEQGVLAYDDLRIDLEKQRAFRADERIDLTKKEFLLLALLAKNPNRIFSKAHILDEVWNFNHFPESNVVEVVVANLRAKIDHRRSPLIHSRRGSGYWLGEP